VNREPGTLNQQVFMFFPEMKKLCMQEIYLIVNNIVTGANLVNKA
jgi:hypothetical protein